MGFMDKLFGFDDFKNQLSDSSVKSLIRDAYKFNTEIVQVVEPGIHVWPGYEKYIPNLLMEFNKDLKLGIIHGQGNGHAFIRLEFLILVLRKHSREIHNYASLVKGFRQIGATVKRVHYIGFD